MTRPPSGESSTRSLRRLKTEKISTSDREQLRGDALQVVQDGEAGTLDEQDETATLQFGTDHSFVDSLTPLRLELNWAITEEVPKSRRKTARLIERNVSDVHSDLKQLEVLGILTLEAGGPGSAIQSIVPFGCIDSPPIDSGDAGGTRPSAKLPLTARRVYTMRFPYDGYSRPTVTLLSENGTFTPLARNIIHRVPNVEAREHRWSGFTNQIRSKRVSHALAPLEGARELARMTANDSETVRGDCSFCGETVTGRHAIIHYETAGGDTGLWAECPHCGEIVDPTDAQ